MILREPRQDGRPLDRHRAHLYHDLARARPTGRDEPPVPAEPEHLSNHDRLGEGVGDLGVSPDEVRADPRQGALHRPEEIADVGRGRGGGQEDVGQEPAGSNPHRGPRR